LTCPKTVNGTFVTTLLGDYFSEKYGVLNSIVRITIKDGRASEVYCPDKKLEAELRDYLTKGENTNRVGEFAIGTNTAVTHLIGNMLADEKAVGVHIAFGDPLGGHTGATWTVSPAQHCDMVLQGCTIHVDGRLLMENGKFILPK
jgi:leucyl aminopeptidase (aminopeptidase T)